MQGQDAAVGQSENGLVVAFPLLVFALVVGPGGRVGAQRGEGGQERGALKPLVAAVGDAPRRGSMSPIFWSLVPGQRRRPVGLWCLEVLPRASASNDGGRDPDPGRAWSGPGT